MTHGGMAPHRPIRVAVVGGAEADVAHLDLAERLGEALAREGAVVVCGGRGGVMAAVARGAAVAGGLTVGILPGPDAREANRWIVLPLPTGLGDARNALVARSGEAVVAVGGAWGTLSEIAHARMAGLSVATLGVSAFPGLDLPGFDDAARAARWAVGEALRHRGEKPPPGSGT